ncbi:ESPR-type extended signal peptide-containing protein [Pseudomonas sp. H9]|uniref:ESPR-type extended signal peptide-containing protein n=1 Tax=Pseudomonas sp. H9 TaxID=483968 RepID=UPI0010578671|nr:ESPR-type extended signal peptide-containing protein [Pseudomonas sp. H9]TDF84005.1 hypothetical protein E1573_09685 [Pseudomonas sp. H9]
MNRCIEVIRNTTRRARQVASRLSHATHKAKARAAGNALLTALQQEEEKNLVWVMQAQEQRHTRRSGD